MPDKSKILIVDDDDSTRKLIGLSLSPSDYDILEAASGDDALRILEDNTIDGMITDYNMPKMTGVELVRTLRDDLRWAKLPVVMISCCFTGENITEAATCGVVRCLAKPFRRQQLRNVVRGMISQNKLTT